MGDRKNRSRTNNVHTPRLSGVRPFTFFTGLNQNNPPRVIRASLNNSPTSVTQNIATAKRALEDCFIAPNPSDEKSNLHYTLSTPADVRLEVYSALGARLMTLIEERQSAGNYVVPVDVRHLPSGQYFYRLLVGAEQTVRSLQVVR
ncbi:MAG: T9SS C-terminal target domain-containing protein [Candidatus Kapaibacterium sp.]|nr:MAG: T9SS C-terminal target domain-containing protein [Candidatus Kapabacteria bacterium]